MVSEKKAKMADRDTRKAAIKEQQARLMNDLDRIESAELREQAEPLIGKCFKYRNSYGHDSKGWWLYAKILSYDSPAYLRIWQFETDEHGQFTTRFDEGRHMNAFVRGEWTSIKESEFKAAWKRSTATLSRKAASL